MCELFVDRREELELLRRAYSSRRKELIIIYGRRRIGKTRLVKESVRGVRHIYFFAEETLEKDNLDNFKRIVARGLKNKLIEKAELTWEELFEILEENEYVVIIDEFPNLIKGNKGIVSKFQKIFDRSKRLKLVLTGSSISIMESQVLGYKSPLYGRRTLSIKLRPLKFFHLKEFFPEKSWEELVRIFGITDGIPAYIEEVKFRLESGEKLEEVFQPNKMLFDEAEFLLRSELREPGRYFKILKAIAFGNTKFGEIVNYTGLPPSTVSQYLENLRLLHIVKEEYPLGDIEKARNRRYYISDLYFTFWFRFVYPNKTQLLEFGYIEDFEQEYNRYLGFVFERVGKEFLIEAGKKDMLPFKITNVGKWWKKNEEIDIIGINEKEKKVLFVEVKWEKLRSRDIEAILSSLKRKAELTRFKGWKKYYGIIAKEYRGRKGLVWDLKDFKEVLGDL
ncbi:hypothetical protein A3L04_04840 [Thermococcus chitonophagus]|uniref:Archaeal ATPase, fused to C-terminal DUF234 domain n=1 Tax=Thermococcus chitonophagus TaxID=54262 RepID=A0A170SSE1_9EURY|nr:ATP-binding protein [Thermococcus chitonophagus]ASJ16447.1 hypothetical protein A3L04_04840 [Thermococcus chitonophagus]CUX78558.1 archaeal ATPase, fused to C-terminal DUF234 domain [Thermococcus chitonophagus]